MKKIKYLLIGGLCTFLLVQAHAEGEENYPHTDIIPVPDDSDGQGGTGYITYDEGEMYGWYVPNDDLK